MANYFDSKEVEGWIIEYNTIMAPYEAIKKADFEKNKANFKKINAAKRHYALVYKHQYSADDKKRLDILSRKLMVELVKICNRIANVHKFTRFEPYDDLVSAALEACWLAIPRYNLEKEIKNKEARCFSYFSFVAKRSMLFYTLKRRAHREVGSLDYDDGGERGVDTTHMFDDIDNRVVFDHMVSTIDKRLRPKFEKRIKGKYMPAYETWLECLNYDQSFKPRSFLKLMHDKGYHPPTKSGINLKAKINVYKRSFEAILEVELAKMKKDLYKYYG